MKNLDKTRLHAIGRGGINVLVTALVVLIWVAAAPGQRGMGDGKGVAQQRLKPRLVLISGKLQEIKTHPCEKTTGKAELGTHLILRDKHGQELNIHLGPAPELSETVKRLTVGRKLNLLGFHTDKMPPNHYVAQTLILGSHIIQLRDSDLRPYWSNNRLGEEILSPSMATTGKRKTSETTSSLCYHPRFWQRRRFQDGQRPRWRRCCRGRAYCRRCEWDN
ncbi:MAG: hypothetical protein HQ580_17165 [Planctomycetes bacterium]|nr:hypothetical protein [Planctomycetota bacterium]